MPMNVLKQFASTVDCFNAWLGNGLIAFVWLTAFVCATVVVLRYVFHISFGWMQELYVWTHALVFMAGIGFAMSRDANVRVDIYYAKWGPRTRAWVELAGASFFTLPWMIGTAWLAWPIIRASWAILEGAPQPNGIPAQFLFKSILLTFCLTGSLQCLALMARAVAVLRGDPGEAARVPFASAD